MVDSFDDIGYIDANVHKKRRTIMSKMRTTGYALVIFILLSAAAWAQTNEIKEHKVVKGDTLWDISQTELSDPLLWPKVWKVNSRIKNPDRIYPDQIIKIPLSLIHKGKSAEKAAKESAAASSNTQADSAKHVQSKEGRTTMHQAAPSEASDITYGRRYPGINGIVLTDGTNVEGEIISMSAEVVKIRTKDGSIMSYSFEDDVLQFIKE